MPTTPALRVEGLGVRYGALVALEGVSWEVHSGELLGIIGPNGAGKSSCYEAVTAMVARQGRVFLGGHDVTHVPPHGLAGRGLKRAFQQNAFFDDLSVLDNMVAVLGARAHAGMLVSIVMPRAAAASMRWKDAADASRGPGAFTSPSESQGAQTRCRARETAGRHADSWMAPRARCPHGFPDKTPPPQG
jgi:ABC-type branched-subunit amino acid transport system ATPase component